MKVPFRRNAFHSIPNFGLMGYTASQSKLGRIFKSDAIDLVRGLPDESVDLIVTDPAYESLEKWRKLGTTTRLKKSKGSSSEWFETFPNSRYAELFSQFYRVLKKGTHLYMFCDEETRDVVLTGFSPQNPGMGMLRYKGMEGGKAQVGMVSPLLEPGFKYWKSIIWDKVHPGMGYHYRGQHELIILAEKVLKKGKHRRLNFALWGDVLQVKRLKGKNFYPTEKPFDLIKILIEQSSNPGDLILDPFCGSGVVGQVCEATGRNYILGDIDPKETINRLIGENIQWQSNP